MLNLASLELTAEVLLIDLLEMGCFLAKLVILLKRVAVMSKSP